MSIESFVIDLIEGKKRIFFVKKILFYLSLIYRAVTAIRNFLYDVNILRSYRSSLPVISIGNIVAGGTGKTPLVQKLSSELSQKMGLVAIVSRGYRSQAESQTILTSEGEGPLVPAALCGDEPYWLASNTNASIWVGKDRVKSLEEVAKSKARLAILEDGFQHRKVKRDVDIVLMNALDLFGKGYFLPRGYLRESPRSLKRADWIVVTQMDPECCFETIEQKIRPFSKAPIVGLTSRFELTAKVKGRKVGAFCGIAKPDSFYEALKKEVEIVRTLTFLDHEAPSREELSQFALECQLLGAEYLVCTEKDRVKLLDISLPVLPVVVLKMRFDCIWNENVWKEMVRSIQTMM